MHRFRFLLLLIIFSFFSVATVFAEPIAVIVNLKNPRNEIGLPQLDQIFKKKLTIWSSNVEIVPLNREFGSQIRETFSQTAHSKSAKEMKEYWLEERYKGGTPPQELASSEAVKKSVAANMKSIGYIYLSEVDETVKVLKIGGLAPKESGYKLK